MKSKLILMVGLGLIALLSVSSAWGAQSNRAVITADNAGTVKQLAKLEGHIGPVFSLAFSPDGKTLASGGSGQDYSVRLWDVASGIQIAVLEGHTAQIAALSFNANGTQLETASYDGTIHLWDAATGAAVETIDQTVSGGPIGVDNLATYFSADGSRLAYLNDMALGIDVFDLTTREQITVAGGDSPLSALLTTAGMSRLSADGKMFALEQVDAGPVHLIDLDAGTEIKSLNRTDPDSYYYTALAISEDGQWLAAVDDTSAIIEVWNVETGESLPNITGHKPAEGDVTLGVYGLAFNPDGSLLATASYDGTVRIWNPADGTQLASLPTSDIGGAGVVVWSPNGTLLASGNVDRTVQIWGVGS